MTQVPEYLLERSRARRAALGLGGDAPATPAPSPGAGEGAAPAAAAPAVGAPAADLAPAAAAPAATVPAGPVAPLPEYVTDPGPKSGIPVWMMPILLLIPLWGIVYMGSFGEAGVDAEAASPAQLYTTNCAACHGAVGEGGVGPAIAGGESVLTFPDEAEHIEWIEQGSTARRGQPYGDPNRAGGQRIATSGGMPGFAGQLTAEQILAIVEYERGL